MKAHMSGLGLPAENEAHGSDGSHPYAAELATLSYTEEMLGPVQPTLYAPLEETPLVWVDTVAGLTDLISALEDVPVVAIDLEAHSYRSFQGFVCLMQVSTRSTDYLVDTLALRSEMHLFNKITADPRVVKVLHGANSDIVWLQRDFGVYVVNMFDTGQAARVLAYPSFGLAHLLKFYCSVNTNKSYQLADWRIRPLPEDMAKYARMDTHYLLYIYDRLKNELVARGSVSNNLVAAVLARSREICGFVYEKPAFTPDAWRRVYERSSTRLSSEQRAVFAALYDWRDDQARKLDESTGYVMPNALLARLAHAMPTRVGDLLAACNPIPPLVRQHAMDIVQVVVAAASAHTKAGGMPSPSRGKAVRSKSAGWANAVTGGAATSSSAAGSGMSGGPRRGARTPRSARASPSPSGDTSATFSEEQFRAAGWLEKPVLVAMAHAESGGSAGDVVPRTALEHALVGGDGSAGPKPGSWTGASANEVSAGLAATTHGAWTKPLSTAGAERARAEAVYKDIADGISFPKIQPLLQPVVSDAAAAEVIKAIPQPQTMSDIYVLSNLNRKQQQERKRTGDDGGEGDRAPKRAHLLVEPGVPQDPVKLMEQMGWPANQAMASLDAEDLSAAANAASFKAHDYSGDKGGSKGSRSAKGAGKSGSRRDGGAFDPYGQGANSPRGRRDNSGARGRGNNNNGNGKKRRVRRRDQNRSATLPRHK